MLMSNRYDDKKFLCDLTVGKLCRYMRMIGFDTTMASSYNPKEILSLALEEHRTILTRNSVLAGMKLARDIVLLTDDDPWRQLKCVIKKRNLEIERSNILTRCLEDNEPLHEIPKEEVKDRVWPYVYQTQERFTTCPKCNRIYWPATHIEAMMKKLESVGLI